MVGSTSGRSAGLDTLLHAPVVSPTRSLALVAPDSRSGVDHGKPAAQRILAALPRAAAADPRQPSLFAQPCCSTTSCSRPSPLLLHGLPTSAGIAGNDRHGRAGPPN